MKLKSAYWHFNTNLLSDAHFIDTFKFFGKILEMKKQVFSLCKHGGGLVKLKSSNYVNSTLTMSQKISLNLLEF